MRLTQPRCPSQVSSTPNRRNVAPVNWSVFLCFPGDPHPHSRFLCTLLRNEAASFGTPSSWTCRQPSMMVVVQAPTSDDEASLRLDWSGDDHGIRGWIHTTFQPSLAIGNAIPFHPEGRGESNRKRKGKMHPVPVRTRKDAWPRGSSNDRGDGCEKDVAWEGCGDTGKRRPTRNARNTCPLATKFEDGSLQRKKKTKETDGNTMGLKLPWFQRLSYVPLRNRRHTSSMDECQA